MRKRLAVVIGDDSTAGTGGVPGTPSNNNTATVRGDGSLAFANGGD